MDEITPAVPPTGTVEDNVPLTPPSSPPDLSPLSLIKQAWLLFWSRWLTFLGIQIVTQAASGLIVMGGFLLWYTQFGSKGEGDALARILRTLPQFLPLLLGLFLLLFLVQSLGQLAQLQVVIGLTEKVGISLAFRKAFAQLLRFGGFTLIASFILVGAYFLFFIPGLIFSLWFSLAVFVFLEEKEKSLSSLVKSREYIRGYTGEVLIAYIVIGVFVFLLSYLPTIIAQRFNENGAVQLLLSLVTIVSYYFIGPLVLLSQYILYQRLKAAKGAIPSMRLKKKYWAVSLTGYLIFLLYVGFLFAVLIPRLTEALMHTSSRTDPVPTIVVPGKRLVTRQFAQADNTQRRSNVSSILNAVYQYSADYKGNMPPGITAEPKEIANSEDGVDLCAFLVPEYLPGLPVDPSLGDKAVSNCSQEYRTGYMISSRPGNYGMPQITVSAPSAALGDQIEVVR